MIHLTKLIKGDYEMLRFGIQLSVAVMVMLVSSLFTWYEGSAIIENPWEWKYSTPFSHLIHGEVMNPSDILSLDYFVYAAKFQPLFPLVMILSFMWIVTLLISHFLSRNSKQFISSLFAFGIGMLFLSLLMFNAHTPGGRVYFYMFLVTGLIYISYTIVKHYRYLKLEKNL